MKPTPTTPWLVAVAAAIAACRDAAPPPRPRPRVTQLNRPGASEAEDRTLSTQLASELAAAFQREAVASSANGDIVHAAGHVIAVHVARQQIVEEMDHTTAVLDVDLRLDDQQTDAFRTTAIAIDANRAEAIQHALREWNVGYGLPIVDAIRYGGRQADGGTLPLLGPFRVYPGPTGLRGETPENFASGTPEMHQTLLGLFSPALEQLIPSARSAGFHSLKLTLHVRNAAAGEGDCRVDGVPSEQLCQLARAFPWPPGPEDYLFKQYYVLAPVAGTEPRAPAVSVPGLGSSGSPAEPTSR